MNNFQTLICPLKICSLPISCYSLSTCCFIIRKLINITDNKQRGNWPFIMISWRMNMRFRHHFQCEVVRFNILMSVNSIQTKRVDDQNNLLFASNDDPSEIQILPFAWRKTERLIFSFFANCHRILRMALVSSFNTDSANQRREIFVMEFKTKCRKIKFYSFIYDKK